MTGRSRGLQHSYHFRVAPPYGRRESLPLKFPSAQIWSVRIGNYVTGGLVLFAVFGLIGATAPLAFEVASIRPDPGPLGVLHDFASSGPRLTLKGYTLLDLVAEAYTLNNYQVMLSGSISRNLALGSYYNVVAKAEGNRTPTKE